MMDRIKKALNNPKAWMVEGTTIAGALAAVACGLLVYNNILTPDTAYPLVLAALYLIYPDSRSHEEVVQTALQAALELVAHSHHPLSPPKEPEK